jgi:hypothetical protein
MKDILPVVAGLVFGVVLIIAFSLAPIATQHYLIPAQQENPYRVDARIAYVHDISHSCIKQPCYKLAGYMLKMINDEPMFLLGYSICNIDYITRGIVFSACIKSEGGDSFMRGYFTLYPEEQEQAKAYHIEVRKDFEKWGGSTIGDIPWEIGETVNIKVKAASASMRIVDNSESWSYDESQAVWIDLGDSQIIELDES